MIYGIKKTIFESTTARNRHGKEKVRFAQLYIKFFIFISVIPDDKLRLLQTIFIPNSSKLILWPELSESK